jgi:hypothetical protein
MIPDQDLVLADDQALTATAATTNKIDIQALKGPGGQFSTEECLFVHFQVTTVLDSAGEAATLTLGLRTDGDTAFGSPTTLLSSPAIAEASLAAGYTYTFPLKGLKLERMIDVYMTVGTENFTSGNVRVWVSPEPLASNK